MNPEKNDLIHVPGGDGFTDEDLKNELIPDRPEGVKLVGPGVSYYLGKNPNLQVGKFMLERKFNHDGGEDHVRIFDTDTFEEIAVEISALDRVGTESDIKQIFEGS
ncbi:MAG: hypothetical protein WC732_01865 [Candidatus Omnitrophota bacterium]